MKNLRLLFVFLALLGSGEVFSQTADDEAAPERNFSIPGDELDGILGDSGPNLASANYIGSPLQEKVKGWPEDLVVAPIPGRSPQIGWNLTLAGGYFLNAGDEDSETPPSLVGAFVMGSENGSYAYGAGANLHLLDDKLRVKAGAGYVDVRYAFYGVGNTIADLGISVDILQEAPMYFASASWRVWNKLYVGLGYLAGNVDSRVDILLPETPFLDPSLKLDIGAITIPIDFDTRDHEQFPRNGWLISGRTALYRKSAGSDFDAETFKIVANHYRPMRDRDVLAFRAYIRTTNGDAPFFLLSTFGGKTDLRGYPSGRYRDRMMYALQSEYRWQYSERWIFTGFAGFGEVAESFSDFGENFLPAAGIGTRFVLSKKHRIGLSMDIAQGIDGTEYYFGIGEAF